MNVERVTDRRRVGVRAARPILLVGQRSTEADRLRSEMEELTGRRVRLDVRGARSPREEPGNDRLGRAN